MSTSDFLRENAMPGVEFQRKATRADLETVALAVATELADIADNSTAYNSSEIRRDLNAIVDRLRVVLPAEAELTIDQRPLF